MAQIPTDRHVTYLLQYRKCGKSSCGTCRGGVGHGPYWYGYWHEGFEIRSGYAGRDTPAGMTPERVAHVQAAAAARAAAKLASREVAS